MSSSPKRTALYDVHAELGARFTDFGGWDMPLKYASELEEHHAVRTGVGIFDLSHMGEVRVTGPDAAAFLDHALISRLSAVPVGKAKYSMICQPDGGIIDDLITYHLAEDEFLVVPNAGNVAAVVAALQDRAADFDVTVSNESEDTSMIAVQGPGSAAVMREVISAVTDAPVASGAAGAGEGAGEGEGEGAGAAEGTTPDVATAVEGLGYYAAFQGVVAGHDAIIARTGYTGEDGFEIIVPNAGAADVWAAVIPSGVPCGLACRDTLRLEAGMPLYGNELSTELNPVDAGLGVLAATKSKDAFIGRDAILAAKDNGTTRRLIGLSAEGRRAPRSGYPVGIDRDGTWTEVGAVTSGALSPTLGHPVAMAYVDTALLADAGIAELEAGVELAVDVRGKKLPVRVAELPFYKRQR